MQQLQCAYKTFVKKLNILSLSDILTLNILKTYYNHENDKLSVYVTNMFSTFSRAHAYDTRLDIIPEEPHSQTDGGEFCIRHLLHKTINNFDSDLIGMVVSHSYQSFVSNVKKKISHYVNHCSTPIATPATEIKKTGKKKFCHESPLMWFFICIPISEYCIDVWFFFYYLLLLLFCILSFLFCISLSIIVIFLQSSFYSQNTDITNYLNYSHSLGICLFFVLIQYYGYRLVSFGWLLRKRYVHTLVGVSWHTCTCTFVCIHLVSIEIYQTILKLKLNLKQAELHWMLFIPIAKRYWQRIRNGTNANEKVNTQNSIYCGSDGCFAVESTVGIEWFMPCCAREPNG